MSLSSHAFTIINPANSRRDLSVLNSEIIVWGATQMILDFFLACSYSSIPSRDLLIRVNQVIPPSAFIDKGQIMAVPTRSCIGVYVAQFKSALSLPYLRQGTLSLLVHISKFLILRLLTHDD